MLKIKDNVDLKELEKFGFKPKYNCNTGEIEYYCIDYFADKIRYGCRYEYQQYQIRINSDEVILDKGTWLKKKEIKRKFVFDRPQIYTDGYEIFVDILFDLIQAGLVEKVEKE